jgi:hypothetical protein
VAEHPAYDVADETDQTRGYEQPGCPAGAITVRIAQSVPAHGLAIDTTSLPLEGRI